jgi:hypothetical protein
MNRGQSYPEQEKRVVNEKEEEIDEHIFKNSHSVSCTASMTMGFHLLFFF